MLNDSMISQFDEYIKTTIDEYMEVAQLIQDNQVTPSSVNLALAKYQELNLKLIAGYQRAKIENANKQNEYQQWYDEKFIKARKTLSAELESKKLKISVAEIETLTRVENKDEYYKWKTELSISEYKESFMRRLVEQYKKWDSVLLTISSNMRSELKNLTFENRLDSVIKVASQKVRRSPVSEN